MPYVEQKDRKALTGLPNRVRKGFELFGKLWCSRSPNWPFDLCTIMGCDTRH